jgi:hypothetical protein
MDVLFALPQSLRYDENSITFDLIIESQMQERYKHSNHMIIHFKKGGNFSIT